MPTPPQPERAPVPETPVPEQAPTPEVPATPEQAPEAPVEQPVEQVSDQPPTAPAPVPRDVAAPAVTKPPKDRLTQEVEAVLEENLAEMYQALSPDQQKAFAAKGEETAGKIRQLLSETKINVRKVYNTIKDWLKMLPGVNKYFLEQEAKIKADKITLLAEQERREDSNQIA